LIVLLVCLAITLGSHARGSVLSELIQSQDESGLTLAWVDEDSLSTAYLEHSALDGVEAISFENRTVVHLQDSLQNFRPDGFSWKEYPAVLGSRVVGLTIRGIATGRVRSSSSLTLEILDLDSKKSDTLGTEGARRRVTFQCWSQDDQNLIYQTDAAVMVINVKDDRGNFWEKWFRDFAPLFSMSQNPL
jgi:hypothetical protein